MIWVKMKKLVLMISIMFLVSSAWAAELPSPFDKAKTLALSGQPVEDHPGCFAWSREVAINSTIILFSVGYCRSDGSIGLLRVEDPEIRFITYNGVSFYWIQWVRGALILYEIITQDDAIEMGFRFFRELIDYRLLE